MPYVTWTNDQRLCKLKRVAPSKPYVSVVPVFFMTMPRKVVLVSIVIKVLGSAVFTSLLIYWAGTAIKKYHDQPVSTYITYSQGGFENNNFIFPYVSFCIDHEQDQILKNCKHPDDEDQHYYMTLVGCLENPEFNITEYLHHLELEANEFKAMIQQPEWIFHQTFHDFGRCFTLDPSNLTNHNHDQAFLITKVYF